jgi:hypothetical protein
MSMEHERLREWMSRLTPSRLRAASAGPSDTPPLAHIACRFNVQAQSPNRL